MKKFGWLLLILALQCCLSGSTQAQSEEDEWQREVVASLAFLSSYGSLLPRPLSAEEFSERNVRSPLAWLQFVQEEHVRLRPYAGSLNEPIQILDSGEANSLDRARLLHEAGRHYEQWPPRT